MKMIYRMQGYGSTFNSKFVVQAQNFKYNISHTELRQDIASPILRHSLKTY